MPLILTENVKAYKKSKPMRKVDEMLKNENVGYFHHAFTIKPIAAEFTKFVQNFVRIHFNVIEKCVRVCVFVCVETRAFPRNMSRLAENCLNTNEFQTFTNDLIYIFIYRFQKVSSFQMLP